MLTISRIGKTFVCWRNAPFSAARGYGAVFTSWRHWSSARPIQFKFSYAVFEVWDCHDYCFMASNVVYFGTSRPTDVSNVVVSSMLRTGYLFFYTEDENFLPFVFRLKFNAYLSFPSCVLSVTPFRLSYHRSNVFWRYRLWTPSLWDHLHFSVVFSTFRFITLNCAK
jgi:hypothetical protein